MEELQKDKTKFVVTDTVYESTQDTSSPLVVKSNEAAANVPGGESDKVSDKAPPEAPASSDDRLHKAENIHIYYLSRVLASLIDLLPTAILSSLALALLHRMFGQNGSFDGLFQFLWLLVPLFEYLTFVPAQGSATFTTLGKNAFKMKIVRADGGAVTRQQLLFRTIFKYACIFAATHLAQGYTVSLLLALAIMWHRRFIYEYLSGTRVVFNDEDVQKTFYPRSTIWTTVAIGWLLLCLAMGTTRLYDMCSTMSSAFTKTTFGEKSPQYLGALEFQEAHTLKTDPEKYPEEVERLENILVLRGLLGMTKDEGYARALMRRSILAQVLHDPRAGQYMHMLVNMDARVVKPAVSEVMGKYSNYDPYRETAKQLIDESKYSEALDALQTWNAQFGPDDNTYDHRDCMEQTVKVLKRLGRQAEAVRVKEQLDWQTHFGKSQTGLGQ